MDGITNRWTDRLIDESPIRFMAGDYSWLLSDFGTPLKSPNLLLELNLVHMYQFNVLVK